MDVAVPWDVAGKSHGDLQSHCVFFLEATAHHCFFPAGFQAARLCWNRDMSPKV
jgi:hypothetical protein